MQVDNKMQPVPGTEAALEADLVLFAMGFSGPIEDDVVKELALPVVPRGRFKGLDANERDYSVPAARRCSPPATSAAGSRSSSGRSAKAARPHTRSTSS